jgi:hypothetical protein
MSSKLELSQDGTPYRCRHDWRFAQARIRLSLKIPELNRSKHSASSCFSTRTFRPAEIKRARLATCRMPVGADRSRSVNGTIIAYPGTVHFRAGKRTAQRHTYAPFFPVLQYNQEQQLFFGGNFWDSRATGYRLRNPDAEQAQGPPVDTQEMGFPDTACVAFRLQQAIYRPLFELMWGKNSLDIKFPPNTEEICETPGGAAVFGGDPEPIKLRPEEGNGELIPTPPLPPCAAAICQASPLPSPAIP